MRAASFRVWLLPLALCGCNVGRPLVDRGGASGAADSACALAPPECSIDEASPGTAPRFAGSTDLDSCGVGEMEGPTLSGLSLRDCTLLLSGASDAEHTIEDADLRHVVIRSEGALSLRIVGGELDRVTTRGSGEDGKFEGLLTVTHARVNRGDLRARELRLVSSALVASAIDADVLSAVDGEFALSTVSGTDLTISSSRLERTHVMGCQTLLVAGSNMWRSRLSACDDLARLYDTEFTESRIDGPVEADFSTFLRCRFGVDGEGDLVAWYTSVDASSFCDALAQLRFSGGGITCSVCSGPLAAPDADFCVESESTNLETNTCEVMDAAPVCESFPRRPRPVNEI